MSIYRERPSRFNDVHAKQPVTGVSWQSGVATPRRAEDEYLHLRKATPAGTLLPATLAWAARLPANLRPTALLANYARIANLLAATWSEPRAFDTYMESLLNDRRGNRQGFPLEVERELALLALARSRIHGPFR